MALGLHSSGMGDRPRTGWCCNCSFCVVTWHWLSFIISNKFILHWASFNLLFWQSCLQFDIHIPTYVHVRFEDGENMTRRDNHYQIKNGSDIFAISREVYDIVFDVTRSDNVWSIPHYHYCIRKDGSLAILRCRRLVKNGDIDRPTTRQRNPSLRMQ